MTFAITFSVWVTAEIYAAKYTALTAEDGRRIQAVSATYVDGRFAPLMDEILRIRAIQDRQSDILTETLTEVRLLHQQRTK